MSGIPQLQIRQQPALLGIDADLGTQDIQQPRATFEMTTERPKQDIRQPRGELVIDQTRAWDALGIGPSLEVFSRIYSQGREIALRGIARRVEEGNRMAQIQIDANPFAEIAKNVDRNFSEYDYAGEASFDNVDISYTAHKAEINTIDGKVNLNTHPNRVEYEYHRGKLDIYMRQYQSIEITAPEIDYRF
ncbi:DUF6470 family protein [Paenibacillus piri]|uniref:Uncharacterized protein n=1 Tax=Paenibacillus piri TaxID=2547395 RepID=A0A4R5KFU9_9BACL|nr:DUF6470 family protein [Paenibacillus piri]TDF93508.1 hypothetical protein E1757_26615 [Paenibacillus piri]